MLAEVEKPPVQGQRVPGKPQQKKGGGVGLKCLPSLYEHLAQQ